MTTRQESTSKKSHQYRIRLSDDDLYKLERCAQLTGETKADIIRAGIERIYQSLKKHKGDAS